MGRELPLGAARGRGAAVDVVNAASHAPPGRSGPHAVSDAVRKGSALAGQRKARRRAATSKAPLTTDPVERRSDLRDRLLGVAIEDRLHPGGPRRDAVALEVVDEQARLAGEA